MVSCRCCHQTCFDGSKTRVLGPVAVQLFRMADSRNGSASLSGCASTGSRFPSRLLSASQWVAWVERSETHQHCPHACFQPPGPRSSEAMSYELIADSSWLLGHPQTPGSVPLHRLSHCRGTAPELNPEVPPSVADRCRGLGASLAALDRQSLGMGV